MHFDVFNGDADGICALIQLRAVEPRQSILVTGVKRDISLVKKVDLRATSVTALDISLDKNREAVVALLNRNVEVQYFDHHYAGELPVSTIFESYINTDANVCTSLLVNEYLNGKIAKWAIVGAFGDNFVARANALGESIGLTQSELSELQLLGEVINYNAYGATVEDLHIRPEELYTVLAGFSDPIEFIQSHKYYHRLVNGYRADMELAEAVKPWKEVTCGSLYMLPDASWARRVSGVFANLLAKRNPGKAHAILNQLPEGGFLVSVRAPLDTKEGADELCRQFSTGGGRKAAAGINHLEKSSLSKFLEKFINVFTPE